MLRLISYLVMAILNGLGGDCAEDPSGLLMEERTISREWSAGHQVSARYAEKGEMVWPNRITKKLLR